MTLLHHALTDFYNLLQLIKHTAFNDLPNDNFIFDANLHSLPYWLWVKNRYCAKIVPQKIL